MPAQTGKSSLFKKLGTRLTSAVKKHAHDEINYGRVDLPGGIKNGVAQLTKCYFKQYENGDNKGEYYFRAEGVVVKPLEVLTQDGSMKVQGLVTSIMLPVCETTNSQGKETSLEEAAAKVINELKKLGADADEMAESPENLEEIAATLQEAGPYFKFTTQTGKVTKEYPNPRVWENWNGVIEDFDPEAADDVEDETGDDTEAEADVEEEEAPKAGKNGKLVAGKKKTKAPVEDEPAEADEEEKTDDTDDEESEEEDLEALAEAADKEDDSAAQKKLTDLAVAAGVSKKWVLDVAKSWNAVAEKIKEKTEASDTAEGEEEEEVEDETEEEEEEEPFIPAKGGFVKYKGKKDRKPMEYEVITVDKRKQTCELKSIDDGKTKYIAKWADVVDSPS